MEGDAGREPGEPCKGKPGALRGRSQQQLSAGGLDRSFVYYAPSTLDPNEPAPILIVPHGFTMNANMMFEITQYAELAEREGFVVLFPNGQPPVFGAPWNVGNPDCVSTLGLLPLANGDDDAFIDAMIGFAEADQCVDREHVFMAGFSMGGYFANEVGCTNPNVRAIGAHSGGSHDLASCPIDSRPALLMHFEGDGLIPYACGTQTRDRWLERNGCELSDPQVTAVQGGRCEYYNGCQPDAQVAMCTFTIPTDGTRSEAYSGHAWSGGSKDGSAHGFPFAIPETESASELTWSFFKKYAW